MRSFSTIIILAFLGSISCSNPKGGLDASYKRILSDLSNTHVTELQRRHSGFRGDTVYVLDREVEVRLVPELKLDLEYDALHSWEVALEAVLGHERVVFFNGADNWRPRAYYTVDAFTIHVDSRILPVKAAVHFTQIDDCGGEACAQILDAYYSRDTLNNTWILKNVYLLGES